MYRAIQILTSVTHQLRRTTTQCRDPSLRLFRRSGRQPSAAVYDVLLRHCFDDKRDLPSAHDAVVTMLVEDQIAPGSSFVDTLTRMCKRMAANERNRPGLPLELCGELSKVSATFR